MVRQDRARGGGERKRRGGLIVLPNLFFVPTALARKWQGDGLGIGHADGILSEMAVSDS